MEWEPSETRGEEFFSCSLLHFSLVVVVDMSQNSPESGDCPGAQTRQDLRVRVVFLRTVLCIIHDTLTPPLDFTGRRWLLPWKWLLMIGNRKSPGEARVAWESRRPLQQPEPRLSVFGIIPVEIRGFKLLNCPKMDTKLGVA